ncbi:hypothetical protein [Bartonella rattaustraliani]|uniref:hypothetical protein n=1 Tax=Bartonella rattaustraliani TaxID=481139 RepID=UPI0012E9CF65|nr:hypothetical protein [Bartonella rattaustraliani]
MLIYPSERASEISRQNIRICRFYTTGNLHDNALYPIIVGSTGFISLHSERQAAPTMLRIPFIEIKSKVFMPPHG